MFWADYTIGEIQKKLAKKIASGEKLIIRDEKSLSGRVHVGSMRGAAIHGIIAEELTEKNIANEYLYEINDFDPFDSVPGYLDQEKFTPFLGMPLLVVPSPDESVAPNYPEYYGKEYMGVIAYGGFHPTYYRLSEKYATGVFNDAIKTALEQAPKIREIYKRISGSQKGDDWFPLSVICESCGKIATTKVTAFDGNAVTYTCFKTAVPYTEGCGHTGTVDPWNGRAKLPWKVEWAAKFKVLGVDIEGAGKDHATKGGARDVADAIAKEVYGIESPFDVPYEFFLVGGAKMSSSKGKGSSAKEVADLLPPHLFRLALIGKDIKQQFNLDPSGDTVSLLFDTFDRMAEKTWKNFVDDESRVFSYIHLPEERGSIPQRFLPRFREIAYIVQMPHLSLEKEVERMKGSPLTEEDKKEAAFRAEVAKFWLKSYAPEQFRFDIKLNTLPEAVRFFTHEQKKALALVLAYVQAHDPLDGQALHTALHDIRKESGLEALNFFNSIYFAVLGRPDGPKAGWFLSVLPRDFLIERLTQASEEGSKETI